MKSVKEHATSLKVKELGLMPINPGMFYESCNYHPCICIETKDNGATIIGISLLSEERDQCDRYHCGVWAMTTRQVSDHLHYIHKFNDSLDEAYKSPGPWVSKSQMGLGALLRRKYTIPTEEEMIDAGLDRTPHIENEWEMIYTDMSDLDYSWKDWLHDLKYIVKHHIRVWLR